MLKRGEKVYTQIVRHCSIKELLSIVQGRSDKDAIIYSDGYRAYDCLEDFLKFIDYCFTAFYILDILCFLVRNKDKVAKHIHTPHIYTQSVHLT